MVLRGTRRRPATAGRLPYGAGRPGERARRPQPARRLRRVPQRVPPPGRPAVHRGVRRGAAQPPVPVPRLDLRPGRAAGGRAQPPADAGRGPLRARAAAGRAAGVAGVRVGVPGRRAAVVRGDGDRRGRRAAGRRRGDRAVRDGGAGPRAARHLRRARQLEADRRELHGVLSLRHHPPRTDRHDPGVRGRVRRAVLRRARRGVRGGGRGVHRRRQRRLRPDRGDRGEPGPPLLRHHHTPAGLPQPGARPRHRAPDVPAGRGPHGGGVRLAVRPRGGGLGGRPVAVGGALPPGQHAGLRGLRADPARDGLAGLPGRRGARPERAPHRRLPPVGHSAAVGGSGCSRASWFS
ncbi:hypothetical protein SRIMM317S_05489 [Streptomyces rimosus subsp. rimosus]